MIPATAITSAFLFVGQFLEESTKVPNLAIAFWAVE